VFLNNYHSDKFSSDSIVVEEENIENCIVKHEYLHPLQSTLQSALETSLVAFINIKLAKRQQVSNQ